MTKKLFYNPLKPMIYGYEFPNSPEHVGQIKIGYTHRDVRTRVQEQVNTPNLDYRIILEESAIKSDGSYFKDKAVHDWLEANGVERIHSKKEWFRCDVATVKKAIDDIKNNRNTLENKERFNRTQTFGMRPEQSDAINQTATYFRTIKKENPHKPAHFLWNAKMRFGKTFTAY